MFDIKFINKLLSEIKLSKVVEIFINLEKRENKFFSLCPFHFEKTPSFCINDSKNLYYCFGCKSYGNSINFLMKYKKFDFKSSVNFLIEINNNSSDKICLNSPDSAKTDYHDILLQISKMYFENINIDKNVSNFLMKRNICNNMIKTFNLGFAPDIWDYILNKFKNSKNLQTLINLGIIIKKDIKYDRFRNRLIFPIKNINGKIIGFGGRIINNEIKPKYINSPESIIFSKRSELYGLYESRSINLSNFIIIVEGYLDVISLFKNGVTNVAGVLGTSFTENHFKILKKLYNKIIFCYDGDLPGKNASFKTACKLLKFLNENIYIGFVNLPLNEDPDSMITFNKNEFLKLLNKDEYILDFIFNYLIKEYDLKLISHKINLFNKIKELLKDICDKNLQKIIFDYFNKCILKISDNFYEKKINNKYNVLSLSNKALMFLIKHKKLVALITNLNIINLKQKKDKDVLILLNLIEYIKKHPNNKIPLKLISDVCLSNNFSEIIDYMDYLTIENEFLALIKKIEND